MYIIVYFVIVYFFILYFGFAAKPLFLIFSAVKF